MDLKCLGLTKQKTRVLEKLLDLMTPEQREIFFEEQDKELHDETYKDLDNRCIDMENLLEEYIDRDDYLTEVLEERHRAYM